jgi:hypothetical protein
MAYNAACQLHLQCLGRPAAEGSFLETLARYREGYLQLRW